MCDQTEVSYLPGDVVWVKLGAVWWPGKVCSNEEIPPEVFKELRKTPIAIVKFFQEDSFEYVKKLSNIYHYNCLKKNEFIKKGLDLCRSNNRDTPSNMKLFPEDIATAEVLTGGNPNIIHDEMFLPEKRPSYAADFVTTPKKTPKKLKIERKKDTPQSKSATPRVITHPRFIRHGICDYEARERKQVPLRAECDEEDNSPPTMYRCPDCDFTTIRLNVIVLHNKSHVRNYAHQHTNKSIKRKHTHTVKFKEKKIETELKHKVSKSVEKSKSKPKKSPIKRVADKEPARVENEKPVVKKRRPQGNTDEFQNSLLQDWAEFENEAENDVQSNDSNMSTDFNDSTASSSQVDKTGDKSCFDFDDSEDSLVIDKSKIRVGRKIPRVLTSKNETTDQVSNDTIEDAVDDNEDGIDSSNENYTRSQKTSQLQEMGVDNEIEIDSEEVSDVKHDKEKTQRTNEYETKTKETVQKNEHETETEELKEKVDQLLEEISIPSKLPDIPYSVKKAHIKSFNESEELARREAEKSAAEKLDQPDAIVVEENDENQQSNDIETTDIITEEIPLPKEAPPPSVNKIEKPDPETPKTPEKNAKPIKVVVSMSSANHSIVLPLSTNNSTTPVKTLQCGQVKLSTTPTFKVINQSSLLKVGGNVKSTTQLAKVIATNTPGGDKTIINKLQSVDGKNLVCLTGAGQSPQKFVINKSKSIILDPNSAAKYLNSQNVSGTLKLPTTAPAQKVRFFTPNILQKPKQLSKTPTKSIVLPSNLQSGNVVLLQSKPIVLNVSEPATTTSNESEITYQVVSGTDNQLLTVDLNQSNNVYITDASGSLIDVSDAGATCVTTKEDILAKALENTDVLQTELTLTDASQSALDTISVAQNTPLTYKTDTVYETNLTLNTPPIMSAYETPSRAVNSTVAPNNVTNEMIIISGTENDEYVA